MLDALYTVIIFPLVQLIDLSFMIVNRMFNPGVSIIAVSTVVTVATLPLYLIAEYWQHVERDTQKRLQPEIKNIRAVFSGDERYMILSTLYRQNHYHPVYALRNSTGLLIQIPFFMAAYIYLSNMPLLAGTSFLFIKDLGAPDGLLNLGGLGINVLPLAMTALNLISAAIYTRGLPPQDKVQLGGMAVVFLVLLYNSPAGLSLYWTCNNLYSLFKNIYQKARMPKKLLYGFFCLVLGVLAIYMLFFFQSGYYLKRLLVALCCFALMIIPPAVQFFKKIAGRFSLFRASPAATDRVFLYAAVTLFFLTGLAIPLALISSSVQEFSFIEPYASPFPFIGHTALQSFGYFIFWLGCIYVLSSRGTRRGLAVLLLVISFAALINTYIFPGNYGFLTITFSLSKPVFTQSAAGIILETGLTLAVCALCLFLFMRKDSLLPPAQVIIIAALAAFSVINAVKIRGDFTGYREIVRGNNGEDDAVFEFSRDGKNVVVIMLDKANSMLFPEILAEKPELRQALSGFTYYPNTVSFGRLTLYGAPPIFGGYDYTPDKFGTPPPLPLVEKHNQSLLLLPRILSGLGYRVTVTDPSWSNYNYRSDISIFDPYPEIRAEVIIGKYTGRWLKDHPEMRLFDTAAFLQNNLLRFSALRTMPPVLRFFIYDDGKWLVKIDQTQSSLPLPTLDQYVALDMLPRLSRVVPEAKNTLNIMVNELPHEAAFLEAPYYTPGGQVTGSGPYAGIEDYHVNMASVLLVSRYCAFLKEQGVYDNTRIIVVADHGGVLPAGIPENILLPGGEQLSVYNPLFLVKDFNARFDLRRSMDFMTNADTPLLALEGIIDHPQNPWTGERLQSGKQDGVTITTSDLWSPDHHGKYAFKITGNEWLHVHDNIFDAHNWEQAQRPD
jgi:YidC/Oxa1 family membrane protein insertase